MFKRFLLTLCLCLGLTAPTHAVVTGTRVGDAAYTATITDTFLITTTAFSAARTWTLPSAGATCIGQTCAPAATSLVIFDAAGAVTSTNTLTIAPASGETINGNAANLIINAAGATITLVPTSSGNWQATVRGDYVAATLASGSAVSLTTATAANVTSQSLSQGDWECRAVVARTVGATTSFTQLAAGITSTSATLPADGTMVATYFDTAANVMAAGTDTVVGPARFSLTATTTVYLVVKDTFTVSTDTAYGQLACRRQ